MKLRAGVTQIVVETAISSSRSNRLVWHWYEISGRPVTSTLFGKLLEGWGRLVNDERGSTLVMIATAYKSEPKYAREFLKDFLVSMPAFRQPGALVRVTP